MINKIKELNIGEVLEDINLKKYTTYKLEEKAKVLVIPNDIESLIRLLNFIEENNYKYKIIGFGSNLIFAKYYDGILIKLDKLNDLSINDNSVKVGSGYSLIKLSLKTANEGLSGLEFAAGIPGTIGGAVFMNAGAYKSDMGYVVKSIKVLTPDYEIIDMDNRELDFHYRTSFLAKNKNYICLEATLELCKKPVSEIMDIIQDRKCRRIESQPLEYPSAGSVFRNPTNDFAGRLVEAIGYKGKEINGAQVSEKHANFIINKGNARGSDIKKLIDEIKEKIYQEYGIKLKLEQEVVE